MVYDIAVLHDHTRNEPHTVLVPCKFRHLPVSAMLNDDSSDGNKPSLPSNLKIRIMNDGLDSSALPKNDQDPMCTANADKFLIPMYISQHGPYRMAYPWPNVAKSQPRNEPGSIPDSLYMFLNVFLGGHRLMKNDEDTGEAKRRLRFISFVQE